MTKEELVKNIKSAKIYLRGGEIVKINNILNIENDGDDVYIEHNCVYYDESGTHETRKIEQFNHRHVVRIVWEIDV